MAGGQNGGTGGPMMKTPAPSGGINAAQPWTGMQPWQQPGGWRQATQPWGMLMPGMLPGMMQQRGTATPTQPGTPGTFTGVGNDGGDPIRTQVDKTASPVSYGSPVPPMTQYVAPGATPPAGLSATTQVGRATMPTAYQMAGDQAVAVDPLLDFWLSQIGSGAY